MSSKAQRESREGKPSGRQSRRDESFDNHDKKFHPPSFEKSKESDLEVKSYQKWLSFLKPRSVLGFDKLPRDIVPIMSGKCRGLALCFEKLQGWTLPIQLLQDADRNYDLTVQLSLSLFHIKSKTFFGSTWMGSPIPLSDNQIDVLSNVVDIDYNEILYIMSRLTDPSCVAVVEVVVSKIDKQNQVLIDQHGCGWTMLTLFALNIPDISLGYHSNQQLMSTMYTGSPRDLVMHTSEEIESNLHELKGCTLQYRVFQSEKLLRVRPLLAENEVIGRFEVVAGLAPKTITLPKELRPRKLACIGDKEERDGKHGFHLAPNVPETLSSLSLRVIDWQLRIPERTSYESRVRAQTTRHIHPTDASKSKILSRRLKICLHNGHTIISNGGEWLYFDLEEDDQDGDLLLTSDDAQTIRIPGYHAHENVALILMIEYEVGIPMDVETAYNAHSTMSAAFREGNMQVAKVLLGSSAYIPFHHERFCLINSPFVEKDAIGEGEKDELSIQLPLRTDDLCQILSQSLIFQDDKEARHAAENKEGVGDNSAHEDEVVEMAFDIKVLGNKEEYVDGDTYDPYISDDAVEEREVKREATIVPTRRSARFDDFNDFESVVSLVGGDSEVSSLRLDQEFYDEHVEGPPRLLPRSDPLLKAGSSLLAKSLKTRLSGAHRPAPDPDMFLEPTHLRDRDQRVSLSLQRESFRHAPVVTQSRDDPGVRELSRGARSRLGRHGFSEVPYDSVTGKMRASVERNIPHMVSHDGLHLRESHGQLQQKPVVDDLEQIADDELSINEINLQFAGYKAYAPASNQSREGGMASRKAKDVSTYVPHSVYFSYQFYTCESTRTEVMRLVPNSGGNQHFILVRDEMESARGEPPLVIRHMVNCDKVSTLEAFEFAKYLTRSTLYVDVWDADSLLYLGTMAVPLSALCRRGESRSGCTLECDVIHCRASSNDTGGVDTTVICNGRAPVGDRVGSVQIVMSNTGHIGIHTRESRLESQQKNGGALTEGLNWRAHSGTRNERTNSKRPKNSVRARPLAENAPKLSRALDDFRSSSDGRRGSMRSLSAVRGAEDVHTVTYDDVIILFKRFQGSVKGTVQYEGPMMKLLDVPSWPLAVRKLIKVFKKMKVSGHDMKLHMMRYADHMGKLSVADFQECLQELFSKFGVVCRAEEIAIIASKVCAMNETRDDVSLRPDEFVRFCATEADRQDWTLASSRLKRVVQKSLLAGVDVEQMLAERDMKGEHTLSVEDFRLFWKTMQRFGKIHPRDIVVVIDHFSKRDSNGKGVPVVSIPEVASFLGIKYVGNLRLRLRNLICPTNDPTGGSQLCNISADKLAVLSGGPSRSKEDVGEKCRAVISFEEMERRLEEFDVYSQIGHEQLRKILLAAGEVAGRSGASGLTVVDLLKYLKIDTSKFAAPPVSRMGVEELLKLLLDRASKDGSAIDQAFRHFDADGDGTITEAELLKGLGDLHIFDSIPNWREEVPAIVAKFDSSGDGAVSLSEFFSYLGAEKYIPNIMQRMTKIFAACKIPIKTIFKSFDSKGAGYITSTELRSGLNEIGGFDDITEADIITIISHFDEDGDGQISLEEFTAYFGERIKQAKRDMKKKNAQRIQRRIRDVLKAVVEDGGSFEQLFSHFDKNGDGSITGAELSTGLRSIPHFDSLSDSDIKDLISVLDKDGDDSISMEEFRLFATATGNVSQTETKRGLTRLDSFSLRCRPIIERLHEIVKTVVAKGKSPDEVFAHLDVNRDGSLTCDELKSGLRKIKFFANIEDSDFEELFHGIDVDGSGEVDVSEFIDCIVNCKEPSRDSAPRGGARVSSESSVIERFRAVVVKALENGASMEEIFARLDSNGDGFVTLSELTRELGKIPLFSAFTSKDFAEIFRELDGDGDGEVKVSEFIDMISPKRRDSRNVESSMSVEPKKIFIKQMTSLDEYSGVRGVCAFLDEDEDGVIEYSSLIRFLKREGVFDKETGLTEKKVDTLLSDIVRKDETIRIQNLVYYVENDGQLLEEEDFQNDSDDADDLDGAGVTDYEFSNDPQTRSLEKKLRHVGRIVSKRGVDIEKLFKGHDTRYNGMVRRTEFLEVLSKLGLYILEQRDSLAADSKDGDGDDATRRLQQRQLSRLRRSGAGEAVAKLHGAKGDGDFKEHLESMTLIDWYRQGQKKMLLQRILSHSLASTIYLYPRFGKTVFFEYPLTNPFGHEERFLIEINDPELKIVSGFDEWLHLRTFCKPAHGDIGQDPVEADMFDVDGAGNVQVSLLSQETLYIPFTLLTLRPQAYHQRVVGEAHSHSGAEKKRERTHKAERKGHGDVDSSENDESFHRTLEVRFISASHGHVVAVLKLNICYRSGVIDRSIMFYEPENSVMNRRIQLVDSQSTSLIPGQRYSSSKYIHCVENTTPDDDTSGSQVLVEWGPSEEDFSNGLDIIVRYRCRPFPGVGSFYILVYNDPYQCSLFETWHVTVHSRQRLDLHCALGSKNSVDLIVRGDRYARRGRAFSTLAYSTSSELVSFQPESYFQLVPGAYNRVVLNYCPQQLGTRWSLVNVVDVDTRELVSSWILHSTVSAPVIMRSYDVDMVAGQHLAKKIVFKNPWDIARRFFLQSSDETVMRVRSREVDVAGHGTTHLKLVFVGEIRQDVDVYLFLNDETGHNEECFVFRVKIR